MKKLYIVGSGGFGREVLWLAERINEESTRSTGKTVWDISGFIDNKESLRGKVLNNLPVWDENDYLANLNEDIYVVVAIGSSKIKRQVVEKLSKYPNVKFATLVDPSVIMSDRIKIGEGSIICAGCILTVDISIGKHVIINLDCTIGHDAVIEDYVTVYPSANISGGTEVCAGAELGTGMQIIQGKKIGKESIIGAGAVVVKDIPEKCTAIGSPARPVKFFV